MKKHGLRTLALLLALIMAFSLLPASALAVTDVQSATELSVYVRTKDSGGNNVDTLLHTYTDAELSALAVSGVNYTTLDSMPWTVKTEVSSGVYIETLVKDAEKYTQLDLENFTRFRTTSTDGAVGNYTYADLYAARYYYPDLHTASGGINEDGELACDPGVGVAVKPMLTISAVQTRLPIPVEGASPYNTEKYALIFGLSESEAENMTSRLSSCKRGVNKVIIDLGNTVVADDVKVTGVTMDKTTASIEAGENLQLTATVAPSNAADKTLTWRSESSDIATVSSTGLVSGVAKGTAVIYATAVSDTTKYAVCTVTVTESEVPATGIRLDAGEATVAVGGTKKLTATVTPSNATDKSVSWISLRPSVAAVSDTGVVTGLEEGTASIVAKCGTYSATCTVTVTKDEIKVTGVTLSKSLLTLKKGTAQQLTAAVAPAGATNTEIYWSIANPGIASVTPGGVVTGKNVGETVLTVITDDGRYTAECTVKVVSEDVTASMDNFKLANVSYPFKDITDTTRWDYTASYNAYRLGLMIGLEGDTFGGAADFKVAQALMAAARLHNIYSGGDGVIDQPASCWYASAVEYCIAEGIIKSGDFDSYERKITRAEMAYVFANALPDEEYGKISTLLPPDVSASGKYAASIYKLYGAGILMGNDAAGTFEPDKSILRREVAAIISRLALPATRTVS